MINNIEILDLLTDKNCKDYCNYIGDKYDGLYNFNYKYMDTTIETCKYEDILEYMINKYEDYGYTFIQMITNFPYYKCIFRHHGFNVE